MHAIFANTFGTTASIPRGPFGEFSFIMYMHIILASNPEIQLPGELGKSCPFECILFLLAVASVVNCSSSIDIYILCFNAGNMRQL